MQNQTALALEVTLTPAGAGDTGQSPGTLMGRPLRSSLSGRPRSIASIF